MRQRTNTLAAQRRAIWKLIRARGTANVWGVYKKCSPAAVMGGWNRLGDAAGER